jgi:hypothetical protein
MAGFVISENGDGYFDVIVLEGYRFLYEAMVRWALEIWRDRGLEFSIEITERQTAEAALLERFGFSRPSTLYTRRFDLTKEPAARFPLEDGFTIVDMVIHPGYLAQRVLRDNAFRDRDEEDEDRLKWELRFYNHSYQGPVYVIKECLIAGAKIV